MCKIEPLTDEDVETKAEEARRWLAESEKRLWDRESDAAFHAELARETLRWNATVEALKKRVKELEAGYLTEDGSECRYCGWVDGGGETRWHGRHCHVPTLLEGHRSFFRDTDRPDDCTEAQ